MEILGAVLPSRTPSPCSLILSLLVALPIAVWLPREGKIDPPPEFYAQEVSLTLWSKSSLKEAPKKTKTQP